MPSGCHIEPITRNNREDWEMIWARDGTLAMGVAAGSIESAIFEKNERVVSATGDSFDGALYREFDLLECIDVIVVSETELESTV